MTRKYKLVVAMSMLVAIAVTFESFPQDTSTKRQYIDQGNSFVFEKLPNGFSYYLSDLGDSISYVDIRLIVKTGFFAEDEHQVQFAHLIEHAAFGSTKGFPNVLDFLLKKGLSFGKDFNANTGYAYTEYYLRIPTDDTALLDDCIKLVYNWCTDIRLDSSCVAREKLSILNEIGGKQQSIDNSEARFMAADAFRRPLSDVMSNVKHINHKDVDKFYRRWYRPDLQAIFISGKFNLKKTQKLVEQIFSGLAIVNSITPSWYYTAEVDESTKWHISDIKTGDPRVIVDLIFPIEKNLHFTRAALARDIAIQLLNEIARDHYVSVYCNSNSLARGSMELRNKFIIPETDSYSLVFSLVINGRESVNYSNGPIQDLLDVHENVIQFGFSNTEFEFAKKKIKNTLLIDLNIDNSIDQVKRHFLYGGEILSPREIRRIERDALDSVSLEYLNGIVTAGAASTANAYIHVRGPRERLDGFPDEHRFRRIALTIADRVKKKGMNGNDYTKPLLRDLTVMQTAPKRKVIIDTSLCKDIDAKVVCLKNGITLILKKISEPSKDARGFVIKGIKNGGASLRTGLQYFSALHSANYAQLSGTKDFSSERLDRYLNCNNLEVRLFVNDRDLGFEAKGSENHSEDLVRIIYSFLRNPNFSTKSLSEYKRLIGNRAKEWRSVNDSIHGVATGDKGKMQGLTDFSLNCLNIDDIRRFYNAYFQSAPGYTVIVAGDFDLIATEKMLIRYFSKLTSNEGISIDFNKNNLHQPSLPSAYELITDRGLDGRSIALLEFSYDVDSLSNRLARKVCAKYLTNALYQRIRWELGAAYFLHVDDVQMPTGQFRTAIWVTSKFGDDEATIAAIWSLIEKLCKEGPNESDVRGALLTVQAEINRDAGGDPSFWVNYFSEQAFFGRKINEQIEWNQILSRISAEHVRAILCKMVNYHSMTKLKRKEI